MFQGLSPNVSKHGFWFDIQPVTGTTLSAKARIQINMNVRRMENFADLSKINDTVFPLIWFEEGIDELGEEILHQIETFVKKRKVTSISGVIPIPTSEIFCV